MNPRLLVFDWDGTLIDSIGTIIGCTLATFRHLGLEEPSEKKVRSAIGLGLRESVEFFYPGTDDALYVGGTYLWRVDLGTGKTERIGPEWLADIDGIEFEADGTVQVTPVGGPLIRLLKIGRPQVMLGEGVSSANHGYLAEKRLALIPTGFDNTVIAIRIP